MRNIILLSAVAMFILMSFAFVSAESGLYASDTGVRTGVNAQVRTDSADIRASATANVDSAENNESRQGMLETRAQKIIEFGERIKEGDGEFRINGRYLIRIREMSPEMRSIMAGKINARTGLNLTAEDIDNKTMLRAYLSNGLQADVKVMPDRASAVALKRLRAKCAERNCTVELKEVSRGNKTFLAYEVKTDKDSRFLFIFKKKMMVRASVDAETGEIILTKKPWWAFLAKEKNAVDEDIDAEVGLNAETTTSTSANVP